jgi:fatty-acyl-CoA synthase
MLAALFAAARIGAVMVPFNWRLSEEELRWIARDAGITALLRGPSHADALPGVPDAPQADAAAEDALLIGYTSGTTGRPKGAVLTRAAFAANAAASRAVFDLTPDDRVLTVLPMFHVGGLNIQTVPALIHGAEVILHERFDAGAFLDAVERDRPTLSLVVPAVMAALVAHPRWASADLSSLRAVGAGSSEVPLPLIQAFHAKGVPVQQVYGATETCPIAIAQTRDEALAAPGSLGRAAPGVEARLDPATGEILVRGPNVMAGYWRDPAGTAAALREGWFATGDVGGVDPEGRFWFTDRLKHLIISGGENISPAEVERVLATAPGVREGAVVGRPDPRWGEVPVAVVVPGEGFDAGAVLRHFEGRLARFKQPRDVVTVDALPRTALGKVAIGEVRSLLARRS